MQYLGANVPQAWASSAIIQLVEVLLGLEADATKHTLRLRPALPEWLTEIRLEHLTVGDSSIDLTVRRNTAGEHEFEVRELRGDIHVEM